MLESHSNETLCSMKVHLCFLNSFGHGAGLDCAVPTQLLHSCMQTAYLFSPSCCRVLGAPHATEFLNMQDAMALPVTEILGSKSMLPGCVHQKSLKLSSRAKLRRARSLWQLPLVDMPRQQGWHMPILMQFGQGGVPVFDPCARSSQIVGMQFGPSSA